MTSWAKVGVRCVCVDGAPRYGSSYSVLPIEGSIYTIASVEYCVWSRREGIGVHLAELRRRRSPLNGKVYPFDVARFRPLITKTQSEDVAMFLELLQKQGEPA